MLVSEALEPIDISSRSSDRADLAHIKANSDSYLRYNFWRASRALDIEMASANMDFYRLGPRPFDDENPVREDRSPELGGRGSEEGSVNQISISSDDDVHYKPRRR